MKQVLAYIIAAATLLLAAVAVKTVQHGWYWPRHGRRQGDYATDSALCAVSPAREGFPAQRVQDADFAACMTAHGWKSF